MHLRPPGGAASCEGGGPANANWRDVGQLRASPWSCVNGKIYTDAVAGWVNEQQLGVIEYLRSMGFQNENHAGSSDGSGSADSSVITIEKRHDRSIE